MSDELPVEAEFEARDPSNGPGGDELVSLDVDAPRSPKAGVALSVLWWMEGEPERG